MEYYIILLFLVILFLFLIRKMKEKFGNLAFIEDNFDYNTSNFICNYYENKSDCEHYMCNWNGDEKGYCSKPEGDFCNKITDEPICKKLLCTWNNDSNQCTNNGDISKINKECLYYSADKKVCKEMGCRVLESVGLNDSELCVSKKKKLEDVDNQLCLNFKPKTKGNEKRCPHGCMHKNIKIKDGTTDICINKNIKYKCNDLLKDRCLNERNKLFCRFDGTCKKNI